MVINNGFFLHNTTINHSAYQIEATGTRYHCHQCGKENNQCTDPQINIFFIRKYVQSGRQIGEVLHRFRNGEDGVFSIIFITGHRFTVLKQGEHQVLAIHRQRF